MDAFRYAEDFEEDYRVFRIPDESAKRDISYIAEKETRFFRDHCVSIIEQRRVERGGEYLGKRRVSSVRNPHLREGKERERERETKRF